MDAAPAGSREGALVLADARGCKEWLNALPLTNIPQAQTLLLETLRALNAASLEALERLKCLELMRDKVAFLQGQQRSRYFGKTLPLSANDNSAWLTGQALLEAMESGYRKVLEAAMGDGEARSHRALVEQRIVRCLGAQMLFHDIVYRRCDRQLWVRLHKQYRQAEEAGWHRERVKDSLEGDETGSSVEEAYVQVVMLQAAYLAELRAHEIDFTEALLRQWVRKVQLAAQPSAESTHALAVDLDRDIGARPLAQVEDGASRRVLDTSAISKSLRRRIKGLKEEETPAALGLPPLPAEVEPGHALQRLHRLWCEGAPPRPPAHVPGEKTAGVVFGLGEIHFFVTGRTQGLMATERAATVETWTVIDEMRGAWRLQRPPTASRGVSIGRVVAMRVGDTAPFFLGMLSALVQETDGRLIVTVTLFPGKPEPIAVRPADARNRASTRWSEGFRLPEMRKLRAPASLVVPSGMAQRGRGLEVWAGEPKESTVYEILERGADFDRVTIF